MPTEKSQSQKNVEKVYEDEAQPNVELVEEAKEIKEDIDKILDEIDEILEEDSEDFVENYIQRGGE